MPLLTCANSTLIISLLTPPHTHTDKHRRTINRSSMPGGTPLLGKLDFVLFWLGCTEGPRQTFCVCTLCGDQFSGFNSVLKHKCCLEAVALTDGQKQRKWAPFFPDGARALDKEAHASSDRSLFRQPVSHATAVKMCTNVAGTLLRKTKEGECQCTACGYVHDLARQKLRHCTLQGKVTGFCLLFLMYVNECVYYVCVGGQQDRT
jgi:hypothetical protein